MRRIAQFIQSIRNWVELLIVFLTSFGTSIYYCMVEFGLKYDEPIFTNEVLLYNLFSQITILAILGLFLFIRGWRLPHIGFLPSTDATITGILLAPVIYISAFLFKIIVMVFWPGAFSAINLQNYFGNIDLYMIAPFSFVNAVFEEVFICAYPIAALRTRIGLWPLINLCTAIRVSYHLYQGSHAVGIIPFGLIFGIVFAKTGNIWPIIIAHALIDYVVFVALAGS